MNHTQLFEAAYAAKAAADQDEFITQSKQVILYFLGVSQVEQIKPLFQKVGLEVRLETNQDWIDLIDGLWAVVSNGHPDRHAVERLIERMSQEKWWATVKTMRLIRDKVALVLA